MKDPSGAVIPGAKVAVVNSRNSVRAATLASAEGQFAFLSLQPSRYTLTVEAAGFRTAVISNLELNVGESVSQVIRLDVGDVSESVTTAANEARVQTADAQLAHAITLRDIDVLPQVFRLPIVLAMFNPGVQIDPDDWSLSRVNGARQGSNNTRLDGVDVNDAANPRLGLVNASTNADSIEELRIVTSGGKAEYGRNAGGQIEMITRSGSNTLHGNAFEYLRNTVLNANDFFANSSGLPRPVFIQNQFGASLGGPIRRNRTFIFGNFQGKRTSRQVVVNRLVPTPQARSGLFRWRPPGSSEVQTFDILSNDPRRKGIDPLVAGNLKLLPDPNNNDIGDGLNSAGFRFNTAGWAGSTSDHEDQFTIRADDNVWNGHRLFLRGNWSRAWAIDGVNSMESRYPGQPAGTQRGDRYSWSIGSDWALTARMVNELRVGYKFYAWDFRRPARLPTPMLLASSWTDPLNPAFGSGREQPVRHITDNITLVHGGHTFKAGLDWRFTRQWSSSDAGIYPNVTLSRNFGNAPPPSMGPSGNVSPVDRQSFENLYNDLLGRMSQVTLTFYSDLEKFQPNGTPRVRDQTFHEYGYFVQDDWKLHPRFVLNLGLRYEFFGVPVEANGLQGTLDKAALISHTARIADFTVQRSSQWYNNDYNDFAPRVGLVWDATGDGKTALRANWGIFFDRLIGGTATLMDNNTPGFTQAVAVYPNSQAGSDVRVSDDIPVPQQPAAPVLALPATRSSATVGLFAPNLRTGYVQQYSFTLQRELFRNTVIEAGYVGMRGMKLFMELDLNQPRIYEDFLAAFRELQSFRASGVPGSASNPLVRMFGSATSAVAGVGASNLDLGAVGAAADSLDRTYYALYSRAGVSNFYLRNFPQFGRAILGTNDGRSYYDSLQLSLRRRAGALRFIANYTFSKSIDNISVDGYPFASPIDNFNIRLNRARGDYDIPHALNSSFIYTLPIGKGRRFAGNAPPWVDAIVGGWDIGLLTIWQSGRVVTYSSGRATGPGTVNTWASYTEDRNIGKVMRRGDGVYWLTPDEISRFSYPAAGEIGTSGRNAFRGPRFFNVDVSLVKEFRITERYAVSFRAEAYNLFNNSNFASPNINLATPASFGKIASTVGNPRIVQMALRLDF